MINWDTGTEYTFNFVQKKEKETNVENHFWRIGFQTQFNCNFFATFAVHSLLWYFGIEILKKDFFFLCRLFEAKIQELEQMTELTTKSHWPNRKYQMCHFIVSVCLCVCICSFFFYSHPNCVYQWSGNHRAIKTQLNGKTCMFFNHCLYTKTNK